MCISLEKILYTIAMNKIVILSSFFLMIPVVASAQLGSVDTFFNNIGTFIGNVLIPLIFGLALLIFIWGMFRFFIWGGGNEEERSKGKQLIIWSIVGFVLMVSIWGIVNIVSSGFFPDQAPPTMPSSLTR
jgi:hypothetical protein